MLEGREARDEPSLEGAATQMTEERPQDPGAYIGHEPELAADTIPGGVGPEDERVAGTATQSTGVGAETKRPEEPEEPRGHRHGPRVTDDDVRAAGSQSAAQDRETET